MVEGKRVGVVIPAYNEELLISATLAGIPSFVDRVFVVDDASTDSTVGLAHTAAAGDPRIVVIGHERNRGVGAAVVTGYKRAIAEELDVICVMNGDNQMDPVELQHLIDPVVLGELDYAKANRLFSGEAWNLIPHYRYLGNAILSLLTKIASGYWHVADSQAGYSAISLEMLKQLDLDRIYPGYGYPNDMLVHLNVWSARVRDIPSRPIYGIGERSGIRLRKVIPRISWLLVNGFFWRMFQKYVIRDFHPLVFFYMAGFFTWFLGVVLAVVAIVQHFAGPPPNAGTAILVALMLTFGVLFTLFAMWFDMETNKDLR
jgi:glycosyltransferase involved in cell wall biosynthesis